MSLPATAPTRTAVSIDGTPIAHWATSGTGPPLLLVHGAMSDHTRWDSLTPLLAPHRVFTMDRRGRGASGDAAEYSLEREFDDVAAVVDAVARHTGEGVSVFGHSLGALCALEAALRTDNVRALVLYEPPIGVVPAPPALVDRIEHLIADGRRDAAVELFFRETVRSSDDEIAVLRGGPTWEVRVQHIHTIVREVRAMSSYRFDPGRMRDLQVPALALVGDAHAPELLAQVHDLVAGLPDAETAVLKGQAHMAVDTAPRLVASTLKSFLARVSSGQERRTSGADR